MVNDVAKLTRSIRRSVVEDRAKSSLRNMCDAGKQRLLEDVRKNGRAIYFDRLGNRYQIERKGA